MSELILKILTDALVTVLQLSIVFLDHFLSFFWQQGTRLCNLMALLYNLQLLSELLLDVLKDDFDKLSCGLEPAIFRGSVLTLLINEIDVLILFAIQDLNALFYFFKEANFESKIF